MFPRAPEICPLFVTHFVEHRGGPHHRDQCHPPINQISLGNCQCLNALLITGLRT